MLDSPLVLIVVASLFTYSLLSSRIEKYSVTAPMIFLLLGVIAGPLVLNWAAPGINASALMTFAELTLALILFTDASQVNRQHLLKFENIPIRLLAIGLPLTIVMGAFIAIGMFDFGWIGALVLAIILAPTDAALAQAIFNKTSIKEKLRHSITVESGLNDGLALPLLLIALAIISSGSINALDTSYWAHFISMQVFAGGITGIAIGYAGGYLIQKASDTHSMDPVFQRLASFALAIFTYCAAEHIGGNGFIAVFLAGLFLKTKHTVLIQRLKEFSETEGQLFTLLMFFLFGLIYIPDAASLFTWSSLGYALLSLTVIRMVPVCFVLFGTSLSLREKLFLGWFGPRGIASILYLLLTIETLGFSEKVPHYDILFSTSVLTIGISVFLHGLSVPFWLKTLQRADKPKFK